MSALSLHTYHLGVQLPTTRGRSDRPRIVVTLQVARDEGAESRNRLYLDALRGAGANPFPLDEAATPQVRAAALDEMDGLLLAGGADLDAALYGQEPLGVERVEAGRDELELAAWRAATQRDVPVLGICRGMQAINVFSGGSLVQHLDGHRRTGADAPHPIHPLMVLAGTRLAGILGNGKQLAGAIEVNSSHHQAVRTGGLAPGLRVAGTAPSAEGELVEALESADPDRWLIGVQCHPERKGGTPRAFEPLWDAFVVACGAASARVALRTEIATP